MKKSLLFSFALLLSVYTMAQNSTANYAFSTNATGSLTQDANSNTIDMTSGAVMLIGPSQNDLSSMVNNIGFTFFLNGLAYTQFSANSNGVVALGGTAIGTTTYVASGGSTTTPRIAALAGDLATTLTGSVSSKVVGTAPNRCLVVQFTDMALATTNTTADATFQVRMYENGMIELVYVFARLVTRTLHFDNQKKNLFVLD